MKFSIVIPTYKTFFLEEALSSVLTQSFHDFELIVLDDCSPEDVKSIVSRFHDSRVQYYRNDHNVGARNLVDNWNYLLSIAQGDYVINMGDDDKLLPCCLEEYSKMIDKYPELNVYHAKTQIIDENGRAYCLQDSRPEIESVYSMIYGQFCHNREQFIGDFCFSKQWLIRNGGYVKFPYALYSDWATANQAAVDKGIANSNRFMFQYRKNRYTISQNQDFKTAAETMSSVRDFYKRLLAKPVLNREDSVYAMNIKNVMEQYFVSRIQLFIKLDISNNLFSNHYWIRNRKKYDIPFRRIISISMNCFVHKITSFCSCL